MGLETLKLFLHASSIIALWDTVSHIMCCGGILHIALNGNKSVHVEYYIVHSMHTAYY